MMQRHLLQKCTKYNNHIQSVRSCEGEAKLLLPLYNPTSNPRGFLLFFVTSLLLLVLFVMSRKRSLALPSFTIVNVIEIPEIGGHKMSIQNSISVLWTKGVDGVVHQPTIAISSKSARSGLVSPVHTSILMNSTRKPSSCRASFSTTWDTECNSI